MNNNGLTEKLRNWSQTSSELLVEGGRGSNKQKKIDDGQIIRTNLTVTRPVSSMTDQQTPCRCLMYPFHDRTCDTKDPDTSALPPPEVSLVRLCYQALQERRFLCMHNNLKYY